MRNKHFFFSFLLTLLISFSCSQKKSNSCSTSLLFTPQYQIVNSEISGQLSLNAENDLFMFTITPESVLIALEEISFAKLQVQKQAKNLELLENDFPNSVSNAERIEVAMQLAELNSLKSSQQQLIHEISVLNPTEIFIQKDTLVGRNTPLYKKFLHTEVICKGDTSLANKELKQYDRSRWIQTGRKKFSCQISAEITEFITLCVE